MTVVVAVCVVVLGIAALLLVVRIALGPTMLDRVVALDELLAVTICGLALEAAVNRHTSTLPILVALALLGFIGSVSIARFTRGSDDVEVDQS
jgi:multicomponent Na+:H+ antiporter subunit F